MEEKPIMKVYKYYSPLDYAFENFDSNQICFNAISNFSDPMEGKYEMISTVDITGSEIARIVNNAFRSFAKDFSEKHTELIRFKYRILSMADGANYRYMWDNYACDGTGFCLEYDFDTINKLSDTCGFIDYKKYKTPDCIFDGKNDNEDVEDGIRKLKQENLYILFSKILFQGDDHHREQFDKEHEIRFVREIRAEEIVNVSMEEYINSHMGIEADKEDTYYADIITKRHMKAKNLHFEMAVPTRVIVGSKISSNDNERIKIIADRLSVPIEKIKEEDLV